MIRSKRSIYDLKDGEELTPLEFIFTPEVAALTCIAVGDRHPWHTTDSPFGGRIMPHVDVQYCSQRQIVNHLEGSPGAVFESPALLFYIYDAEYFDPAKVGETVGITGKFVRWYLKRGRKYGDFEHEIRGADGRLIAKYRSTYVAGYKKTEVI